MVTKKSAGEIVFDVFNHVFMVFLCFIFIYPIMYCLFASFSDPNQLARHAGPLFKPLGFSLQAYQSIFKDPSLVRSILNTVFYVVAGTSLNLLMTSLAAYVLSRKGFYWKKAIMFMIVFTMYFGGGLIPFYVVVRMIGLNNSPLALIIPSAVSAFNIIIMRTYFMTIPDSMEESAKLDGANDFIVLFRIMLPLAMPVVAVMIIYYGVGHWNSWFDAMIFLLKKPEWRPLQLTLRNLLLMNSATRMSTNTDPTKSAQAARLIQYALIIVTIAPILAIYPFMQRHFIKGVMIGSIKE
ncbi:MAG TPA: carbohydrate ABC transporter permease [Clostridiales bacterium]|nr:carbohydrate ABC transporter permease [Clostridiales bacterium]